MKSTSKKLLGKNIKRSTAILVAIFLIFATACSSSDVKVADESDIPAIEETGGGTGEAESSETEETTTGTTAEETEESETEVAIEEEEEVEEVFECPWDVGMKTGDTSYGPGSSFLVDARVGAHTDYDRFVLEFESGDATPDSYVISWTTLRPERDGSGLPVDVDGDVFLSFSIGASLINWDGAEEFYDGPTSLSSPLFGNLVEVESGGYFEGRMLWAIGANEANGFQVLELEDPPRLVVDVCVTDASGTKGEDCIDSGMHPSLCGALFEYTGGYSGPHAEHAEMFGSGECPSIPPASYSSWGVSSSYYADLNGDGDDEEAFTYVDEDSDELHLRIIDGADQADYLISSTSFGPGSITGALDLQADDSPELFVYINGATPAMRTYKLFQLNGCEISIIQSTDTGSDFQLSAGYVPAAGASAGIRCVSGAPVLRQLNGGPADGPPATTWEWAITTHELLSDNTMNEVSVSETFSGSEIPWSTGFNSCTFE
tara:strand:- start:201 stop:1667 length:1467 start_codon:yes stop_codon:yes gene_type:complete